MKAVEAPESWLRTYNYVWVGYIQRYPNANMWMSKGSQSGRWIATVEWDSDRIQFDDTMSQLEIDRKLGNFFPKPFTEELEEHKHKSMRMGI